MLLAVAIGIPLGVLAARRHGGSRRRHPSRIGGISMPAFWLGLLLQVLFAAWLRLLPATGQFSPETRFTNPFPRHGLPALRHAHDRQPTGFRDAAAHLILPASRSPYTRSGSSHG